MKPYIVFFILVLSLSCSKNQEQSTSETPSTEVAIPTTPSLEQVWASDTLLRTPESVLYDRERKVIYVANVNMDPWGKDGNGFISKMDLQGNIIDLEWITGLNGPKGMGIHETSLFVADIDEVVEISIESGQIVNRFKVDGEPTLNDITVGEGVIYISGSDSNKVFEIRNGTITEIMSDDFGRPNGLYWEPERLLMLTSNSSTLKSIDLESGEITDLVGGLGHGDGIVPVGNGDYLASSWRGEIFYIENDWSSTQLLDTRDVEINAADIDYIPENNLLLVPTFFNNRVVAYKLIYE